MRAGDQRRIRMIRGALRRGHEQGDTDEGRDNERDARKQAVERFVFNCRPELKG